MEKNLETLMKDYLRIFLPYIEKDQSVPAYLEEKLNDIQAEIIEILLSEADKPIFVSDKKLKDIFNQIIPHLFSREDYQFLYDKFDESGEAVDIVGNYLDRFLTLKPFLLISNLPENVNILLSDAIRAYLYGCNRAAVILCGALLEESLKEKLTKIDESLVYKRDNGDRPFQLPMPTIIDNAISNNILEANLRKKAKDINRERNNAIHHCKLHNSNETLKIIEAAKASVLYHYFID
jgi:hypothetical protein